MYRYKSETFGLKSVNGQERKSSYEFMSETSNLCFGRAYLMTSDT